MSSPFRIAVIALALAPFMACMSRDPAGEDAPAPFTLRDSTRYEGQVDGGSMALLYQDGAFVDSVDLDFGVWAVGRDSLLFLPVRAYTVEGDAGGVEIGRHVMLAAGQRTVLDTLLPYFSSGFSSPAVFGRQLMYWGLRHLGPSGYYELYAIRHVFGSGQVDSIVLGRAGLYTDARFHLPPPILRGDHVLFRGDSGTFFVDTSFRRVRSGP